MRRWQKWAGGSAMATAFASAAARPATACHVYPDPPGYEKSTNIGFTFGISLSPRVTFLYGLDFRIASGTEAAFVRLEGRGGASAQLVVGAHFLSDDSLGLEFGVAGHTGRRGTDLGPALGIHLAGGPYKDGGGLQVQGTIPLAGDSRNHDFGAAAVIVPYEVEFCVPSGRRLREGDATVLPAVARLGGVPAGPRRARGDGSAIDPISWAWIEDARAEYASIWAFERMAKELRVVGAPADLARAACAAADDEARHTLLCVARSQAEPMLLPLADRLAAARWDAPSDEARVTLAREAWIDGCIGEGVAASLAAASARRARNPEDAAAQGRIADDERRHAELAWSVLEWLYRDGGPAVRDAIVDLVEAPPSPPALREDPSLDPELAARCGRPTPEIDDGVAEEELTRALDRARRSFFS